MEDPSASVRAVNMQPVTALTRQKVPGLSVWRLEKAGGNWPWDHLLDGGLAFWGQGAGSVQTPASVLRARAQWEPVFLQACGPGRAGQTHRCLQSLCV